MRIAVFDTHKYDRDALVAANEQYGHELTFLKARLQNQTAILARGFPAVCCFVNDRLDAEVLAVLADGGVRLVALRSAGFNHVALEAAARLAVRVVRVPAYSPHAVAEHTFALLLALVRKIPRAAARVREADFSLDGLVGFNLHQKTVGIVGTGKIGAVVARIANGFGCQVLATDLQPDEALAAATGLRYVDLEALCAAADVISLHLPLTPATRHLIDAATLARTKRGVVVINTSRGGLVDTRALIAALKTGHVGAAGLDVYEEEEGLFFRDLSDQVLQDDVLARLLIFPNVLITAHQGFLTSEALANIATATLANVSAFEQGAPLVNEIGAAEVGNPARTKSGQFI